MKMVLIILLGLIIGSFLNVCIYRISRDESIFFPQSHCTSCGYSLKPKDLVPVFSYIFLGGRCRSCKEKISITYPLVETLNACLYLLIYLKYGFTLDFLKFCLFASLLIVIGFIDFETKYVYNSTVIFGVVSGVLFDMLIWVETKTMPWNYIVGAFIGFGVIYLIVILTHGMGEGDIDIALICGLFLGVEGIVVALFIAIIIGGIVAGLILIFKLKNKKDEIAFVPYLAIGGIIASLYGSLLIEMYFKSF
ncbi:MAG: prepilin peptidase [Clostridium sp.]|uniref:prepilin peptidase n=1 Tax=Clostridium sp. TaxID=1506 RepID=UPI0025C32D8C|nr:A24 family peptidase [Clostridium sp.]MBS4956397.1 prepilin peptidase [Clostridium sp.]